MSSARERTACQEMSNEFIQFGVKNRSENRSENNENFTKKKTSFKMDRPLHVLRANVKCNHDYHILECT